MALKPRILINFSGSQLCISCSPDSSHPYCPSRTLSQAREALSARSGQSLHFELDTLQGHHCQGTMTFLSVARECNCEPGMVFNLN